MSDSMLLRLWKPVAICAAFDAVLVYLGYLIVHGLR